MHIYFYAYKGFLNSKEQSKYKKTPSPRYMRISYPVVIKSNPKYHKKMMMNCWVTLRYAEDFFFWPWEDKMFYIYQQSNVSALYCPFNPSGAHLIWFRP